MAKTPIKLSYVSAQCRVRCEFTKAHCDESPVPPNDLIEKAKKKIDEELKKGTIVLYKTYEERFKKIWQLVRNTCEPKNTIVVVTLASGSPFLKGLKVKPPENEDEVGIITIKASAKEASTWRHFFLKLTIQKKLEELGVEEIPDPSHIKFLWLIAACGFPAKNIPLRPLHRKPENQGLIRKPYIIFEDENQKRISVAIYDVVKFNKEGLMPTMIEEIQDLMSKKTEEGQGSYYFLYNDLIRLLRSASRGPERYGLDLPLVMLAAVNTKFIHDDSILKSRTGSPVIQKSKDIFDNVKAKPVPLNLEISKDKMLATIKDFDMGLYSKRDAPLSLESIKSSLRKAGIKYGITDEICFELLDRIEHEEPLDGCTVAKGFEMYPPFGPALYTTYNLTDGDISGTVDMRERQQRRTVRKGQLVAEIRYSSDPRAGKNIFGDSIPIRGGDPSPQVSLGEGIESKDGMKFYALYDGLPVVSENHIELQKVLIHNGDVNLSTGNIRFNGAVEIQGNVETGAYVEVEGDLLVRKSILGGVVRCSGNITVEGGIKTGSSGYIRCNGNIAAAFIENTKISCKGSISAKRLIMASEIFAGGSVTIEEDNGLVTGGLIACFESLKSANIGRPSASITRLIVGTNWKAELALKLRSDRLKKITEYEDDLLKQLHLLSEKTEAQQTKRNIETEARINSKLEKLPGIKEKLQKHIELAKTRLSYNDNAVILVSNVIHKTCKVTINGKDLPINNDVAGVAISGKGHKAKIVSIEDFKAGEKTGGEAGKTIVV